MEKEEVIRELERELAKRSLSSVDHSRKNHEGTAKHRRDCIRTHLINRKRRAIAQPEGLQIVQAAVALLVGRRSTRIFSLLAPFSSLKSLATHPLLFIN
jgi:hypothetical protein